VRLPFFSPSLSFCTRHDFNSVHDGWGIALEKGVDGNAIEAATTTNMDTIAKDHSYRTLQASGTSVGLSEGLMGNSEVGYV
jgi:2,3-bisphosphoglycerate-independent phosphoglycerate mutase